MQRGSTDAHWSNVASVDPQGHDDVKRLGYARVSSLEQARDSSALEQQQERLRAAGCSRIYSDVQSGTKDSRPQLKAVLAALSPDDTLIATRLDRLTRSPSFNEKLLTRFSADGAPGLLLLDDGLDLKTVSGRLTARLLAAVSAGEVERLAERTAHGRTYRQSKGGHSAKPPWGFRRSSDGLGLEVDPTLRDITTATIRHFLTSRSVRTTATWLMETHGISKPRSGLKRWLQNPALAGGIGRAPGRHQQRQSPDGTVEVVRLPPRPGEYQSIEWNRHTGLIDRHSFEEIKRALAIGASRGGGAHRAVVVRTWMSSRFRCQGCGSTLVRHHARLRCDKAGCSYRYGRGSVNLQLALASLRRAVEWMGCELAYQLAPLKAAAMSTTTAEPPALLQLRSELQQLQQLQIAGTESVIADKQRQIAAMTATLHGNSVTAAAMLEQLLPDLRQPWQLSEEQLLVVLDDAEIIAETGSGNWVVHVHSARFGCSWKFDPQTRRETFKIDLGLLPDVHWHERQGLAGMSGLHQNSAWWDAVEAEFARQS